MFQKLLLAVCNWPLSDVAVSAAAQRPGQPYRQAADRADRRARHGVILLVVMVVLALFTLLGLTLVLVTAQGRLSAKAAWSSNPEATRTGAAMDEVFNQVVRGTWDPDSVLQAHSLLEDMYGPPQLFGRVTAVAPMGTTGTLTQSGQLLEMSIISTAGYVLVPASGAYLGQIITMLDGPAQGRSARIVGYAYNAGTNQALLQISSLDGLMPIPAGTSYLGDQFVVNGRPFCGTGFGFNWYGLNSAGAPLYYNPAGPAYVTPPSNSPVLTATDPSTTLVPYALLPNHAQFTPNPSINYYDPGGPAASAAQNARPFGSANEPYDAVDFQNMLLSLRYYDATLGHVVTVSPSLHRPELLAYFANWANLNSLSGVSLSGSNYATTGQTFRSKVILRPEPNFQQFLPSQDLNVNGVFDYREPFIDANSNAQWDKGEVFIDLNYDKTYTQGDVDFTGNLFNPITGPYYWDSVTSLWQIDTPLIAPWSGYKVNWDVDNDNDGQPDSIWVDLGLPVQTAANGTQYKYLAAILCEDQDGRINLNAHGNTAQLDINRYGGTVAGPYLTASGTGGSITPSGTAPIGQGYGTAEINPAYLLQSLGPGGTTVTATGLNYFSLLMQGFVDTSGTNPVYTDGKYGESGRIVGATFTYPGVNIPTATVNLASSPLSFLHGGPRPGWSRWIDPYYTATYGFPWVNDPMALARFSDVRPLLLQPSAQWSGLLYNWNAAGLITAPPPVPQYPLGNQYVGPGYFFDFVGPGLYANLGNAQPNPFVHVPTAYGTPHDLQGLGVVGVDLHGQPYYGSTTNCPWMAFSNDPNLASNQGENDAVDSPYELDLSRNAQHDGRNTGDNYSGSGLGFATIDAPFTPTEFAGILRMHDVDSASLRTRVDYLDTKATGGPVLASDPARLSVTTESWDLPVPGLLPTPLQVADIMTFNNKYIASGPIMPLNGLSVADLARARIFAENIVNPNFSGPPSSADLSLFGNPAGGVWPLLSPDLVMGLRLDVNRLLGNGQDDNGNGVVDEPLEALLGEAMLYPINNNQVATGTAQGVWAYLDHNNDGLYPLALKDPSTGNSLPTDLTLADTRARQLLARHLYAPMMLLIDDRFVSANEYIPGIFSAIPTPPVIPTAAMYPWNMIPPNSREQAAYLVAQWAINAVDFRDRDSIMTPFEFDTHPFFDDDGNAANGTWDVDDIVGSRVVPSLDDTDPYGVTLGKPPVRGLVWGCERPSLLMTETLAYHDRGTDDTNTAAKLNNGMADTVVNTADPMQDQDYDQVRRPRGTVAVELFNTTSPSDPPARDLQYDFSLGASQPWTQSNAAGVNLGQGINLRQVAYGLASSGNPTASPVWRLAIAISPNGYDSYTGMQPTGMKPLDPCAPVLPDNANLVPGVTSTSNPNYIYRVAYFAPYQASFTDPASPPATPMINGVPGAQSFFGDPNVVGGFLMLPSNQYGIVASAALNAGGMDVTYLGDNTPGSDVNVNPIQFQLGIAGNNYAQLTNGVGAPLPAFGTGIKPVIGVPIQTNWLSAANTYIPQNGGAVPIRTLRFSISEPPTGYPVVTGGGAPITADDGFYYTKPGSPVAGLQFPQHPWDSGNDATVGTAVNPYVAPGPNTASGNMNDSAMTLNYTWIYLQRLANPLAVWDPFANPYITVDKMPLDLAAYNGEYSGTSGSTTASEPLTLTVGGYGYTSTTPGATAALESRRRGNNGTATANTDAPNVWTPTTVLATAIYPIDGGYSAPMPTASFGYLNYQTYEYGPYWSALGLPQPPVGAGGVLAAQYYGDPSTAPFPWFAWNDRPFISQYELMLVPVSSPSSMLSDFGMVGQTTMTGGEYFPGPATTAGQLPIAAFRNLLNFDDSQSPSATNPGGVSISHLYRIFEYIHVPSRFTGTQTMLTPGLFSGLNAGPTGAPVPHYFHPPFNWLSRYREPGRMNLNTMVNQLAFQGLMDNYPGAVSSLWPQLLNSRQGFTTGASANYVPNPMLLFPQGYPTYYANPLRPDSEVAFTPPLFFSTAGGPVPSLTHQWISYTPTTPPVIQAGTTIEEGVNATLMRMAGANSSGQPNSFPTTITPGTASCMLDDASFDTNNTSATYSATTGTTPFRQAGRNAYFQYQAYQRLGNLVTNRSNVYAIWITLGKFQVQPVAVSTVNPDGYQIIGEMGVATGDVQRERAFYIFDRSIPVGFVRGQNLNVENAVLTEQQLD